MFEDFAGNTLGTAKALELTSSLQTFTGSVSPLDTNDYYSLTLSNHSSFNMTLSGLGANVDVELLNSRGEVLQNSAQLGTSSESLFTTLDAGGSYYFKVYSGAETATDYKLSLSATPSQDATSLQNRDSLTGFENPSFDTGVFTVGSSSQVSIDYLFDGGLYQGELAIFSLEGMEQYQTDLNEFIAEAARRALSDSDFGHVVISDSTEGARFHGSFPWEPDYNSGEYLGVSTFSMRPGDTFGVMLVPDGTVQQVFDNPSVEGAIRPLFSLSTTNPDDAFHVGQIADATGYGDTFIFEDLRVDTGSDYDYNDIIFRVRGATGEAILLDDVIDQAKDWRDSELGRELLAYADASINFDSPQSNQPLVGIIDTGFNANNPDIDYSRIILGSDRIDGDNNPLLQTGEGNEHGTHILGIIGATRGNGLGIDGINDQAPIWLGRAVGSSQWAESLVEFVDAAKASGQPNAVVNLSFDLTQTNPDGSVTTRFELTPQERQALEYARQNNVLIVAAAGNDGGTMSVLGQASQEFDNIITVGSVDYTGNRADYSNYGNGLDLVAFGGTSEELVTSTLDSGADLSVLTDINLLESSADLSPEELQAYEEAKEVAGKLKLDELDDGSVKTYLEVFNDYLSTELDALGQSSDAANEDVANHLLAIQQVFQSMQAVWEEFESVDTAEASTLNTESIGKFLNALDEYIAAELARNTQLLGTSNQDITTSLLAAKDYVLALKETLAKSGNGTDPSSTEAINFGIPLDLGVGGMAGTSVAAAKVTGAASQVWAANPGLNYLQVKEILKQTAVDLNTPDWDVATGAGLVSLAAAVLLAKTTIPQPYDPEALLVPTTWDDEGQVTPTERAASSFNGVIQSVGDVAITGWLRIRSDPSTNSTEVAKIPSGTQLTFDGETLGDWVYDTQGYGSSRLWYHLADGRGWMSALYIEKVNSGGQPHNPGTSNGFIVSEEFQSAFQQYGGVLGNAVSAAYSLGNGVKKQRFENGYIIWNGVKATVYQLGNVIGNISKGIAVPRRYTLHPRPLRDWKGSPQTPRAGIFGQNLLHKQGPGKGQFKPNWVVRVDPSDTWNPNAHLNINKYITGAKKDPHIKISPKFVKVAGGVSRVAYYATQVARPLAIGLSIWNIGSALREDNWRFGQNTRNAIGSEAGGWAGAAAGAWAVGKVGAAVGLALGGPVGAAVGGLVGGLIGGIAVSFAGAWAGESLANRFWR